MEFLKNSKLENIFENIIFALFGIASIVLSFFDTGLTFCYTLAGLSAIVGLFYLCGFFYMLKDNNQALLSRSIILLLLSIVMIFFSNQFLQIFTIVSAVFLFYNAIQHLTFTLDIKAINEHHWKIDLIFSILLFTFGVLFIVMDAISGMSLDLVIRISGFIFVFASTTKIILITKLHPSYNKR